MSRVPRPARSRLPCLVLRPLLLLLSLLCALTLCASDGPRQQHNVWYNGLFISGIAVNEASGDVFFSDAASNRVVHQARNGSVLHVYDDSGFLSPMQLAYHAGVLYVADSSRNRIGVIDVASGTVSFSSSPPYLKSVSGLAINADTVHVRVVDGWGLSTQAWSPESGQWSNWLDLSTRNLSPLPHYLASLSLPPYGLDTDVAYVTDPTQPVLYLVKGRGAGTSSLVPPRLGVTAVCSYPTVDSSGMGNVVLSQQAADEPMHIARIHYNGTEIQEWTAPGRGGAVVPFYGWAMFVDSNGSMYVSDHGVDAVSSPYGRIVKLAANGSEAGSWSMSDGVAYAFSSIGYSEGSTQGASCTLWMADSERGMVRVSAEGALLLPFYDAVKDPADNVTARLTGIAVVPDAAPHNVSQSFLLLLDTASNDTTKLWRFVPYTHSYTLLNTTAAQLGAHITGVAVDVDGQYIYVTDTRTRSVVRLHESGELDASFNSSGVGFVEPCSLVYFDSALGLVFADSAYGGVGVVALFDPEPVPHIYNPFHATPPMFRPHSVTVDPADFLLYAADSNGHVFEFSLFTFNQRAVHQPVPTASHIVSMTVSAGNVYMVDAYSRRLVILSRTESWIFESDCTAPLSSVSSSSSSSSASFSSSSTGASSSPAATVWSASAVLAVAVMAVVAVAGGGACFYRRWKRQQRRGRGSSGDLSQQLMVTSEHEDEQAEVSKHEDWQQQREGAQEESGKRAARGKRWDYYVARYEVVAAMSEAQPDDGKQPGSHASTGQPLSIHTSRDTDTDTLRLPAAASKQSPGHSPATASTSSAKSVSASSTSSTASSSGDSDPSAPSTASPRSSGQPASHGLSDGIGQSPQRIAELQAAWPTSLAPTFISSVTDLTILGEGSSGVVYRGVYRGQACVVKLAKSAALTSLAWREWQCHLCLPPHRHLVRFLGALPMSSTSYLVLVFVRQGSLHSLLCSSQAARSVYSRPYSVMRCMRDMCAALHHIHLSGIVHRDVSCRNILVDSDGCMVLCDLGLAIQLQWRHDRLDSDTSAQSRQATLLHVQDDSLQTAVPVRWTSPESLASSHYSTHSDVWSLGVAVWEMTAGGALPYADTQHSTGACIRQIVARQLTLHIHEQWGREHTLSRAEQQLADRVRRLTHAALQYDVQQRPDSHTMQQAVESEWNEWQAEWASEADELHDWWAAYHAEVQRRLGPPCRYDD